MIGYQSASTPRRASEENTPVFARVVAGVDFSPASLAATRWATSHITSGSEIIISHVVSPPHGFQNDDRFDGAQLRALRQTTPAVHGGLGGFAATLDVAATRTVVRMGRASHWLSVLASDANASLLVLGRRTDSNRRGIGEPNVLERSARRTRASVLIVPEGTTEPPRHIIAAIDRSDVAHEILTLADSLARSHGCPLVVLHVVPPSSGAYDRVIQSTRGRTKQLPSASTEVEPEIAEQLARTNPWLAELAHSLSSSHRTVVAAGDPARQIVAVANRHAAPLIVVGKRGQDAAPRDSLGSVARELLTRAPFPVLAVEDGMVVTHRHDSRAREALALSR